MGPTVRPPEEIVSLELFRLTPANAVCQNRIEINACFDPDSSMTEFAKIASAVKMWGWGRAGMVLAAVLLLKHVVTFDQALILILVNVVLDRLVYGKQPSPRSTNGRSSGMAQNRRRRPKTIKPIEGQPVRTGGGLPAAAAGHSSRIGVHRKLHAGRIENTITNK